MSVNYFYAQTCLVDTLIKELNIDSSKYSIINFKYIYPDTIEFHTNLEFIKIKYETARYLKVFNNNKELISKKESKSLIYGDIRRTHVYLFETDWIIIIIPLNLGYNMSDYIIIHLPTNSYYNFLSISSNPCLLNDYNNDGIIDFLEVDFEFLTHKSIALFYKAIILNYIFINYNFELQNVKVPENKNIFLHEKCGCYTKRN
jgi:hypothetical protein